MKTATIPHPCLKWPGGKRGVVEQINDLGYFPKNIDTYYEPFIGAGAVFFYLYNKNIIDKAVISDINFELYNVYTQIKNNPYKVLECFDDNKFTNDAKTYYVKRERFNNLKQRECDRDGLIERAALMIYLNRTAYSGMYRENKNGLFNVPFGYYKNPTLIDEDNIISISDALKDVVVLHGDYISVLSKHCISSSDFVYFDPPYMQCEGISHFKEYNKIVFDKQEQLRLARYYNFITSLGIRCMLSNSSSSTIEKIYKQIPGTKITTIGAPRLISRKYNSPNFVDEFLIINYNY